MPAMAAAAGRAEEPARADETATPRSKSTRCASIARPPQHYHRWHPQNPCFSALAEPPKCSAAWAPPGWREHSPSCLQKNRRRMVEAVSRCHGHPPLRFARQDHPNERSPGESPEGPIRGPKVRERH
eukprot:scaffold230984_cov31-Tisochrysis_lutea.AAC.4